MDEMLRIEFQSQTSIYYYIYIIPNILISTETIFISSYINFIRTAGLRKTLPIFSGFSTLHYASILLRWCVISTRLVKADGFSRTKRAVISSRWAGKFIKGLNFIISGCSAGLPWTSNFHPRVHLWFPGVALRSWYIAVNNNRATLLSAHF